MGLFKQMLFILALFVAQKNACASDTAKAFKWHDVLESFGSKEIDVAEIYASIKERKLSKTEVIDARADTSTIGFFSKASDKPFKVIFTNSLPLSNVISGVLKNPYSDLPGVLLVVKQLVITDLISNVSDVRLFQAKHYRASAAICKIDVFINDQDYYLPLTQVDTTLYSVDHVVRSGVKLISITLNSIQKQIEEAINRRKYLNRKKFSKDEIASEYQKRNDYPIISAAILNKGVYSSVNEFKNNLPSVSNFVIKPNRDEPPSLYMVDDRGNETFTRRAWGVCDGTNIYIMQSGLLFRVFRNEKAFYWMGVKNLQLKQRGIPIVIPMPGGFLYGMEPTSSYLKIHLTPYLLNMDTGEEY
jgi:hypothetical protein